MAELAPYLEQAMARKVRRAEMSDAQVPSFAALGRQVADYGKAAAE
jgi:hypothetical protein